MTAGPSSSSSSMYNTYSSSSSRPASQRDSTVLNSPNSYASAPNPTTAYAQSEPWRPPSAQSYMSNNSAPAGRPYLGERRASRDSMATTGSAPGWGPRDRPHSRSSSTAFAGSQTTPMPPVRPASSTDQRASFPPYPTSTSSMATPPPTDEFNPFAAAGVTGAPTPLAQKRQTTPGYYPGVVSGGPTSSAGMPSSSSTTPWVPPGAARPANVYGRRFG